MGKKGIYLSIGALQAQDVGKLLRVGYKVIAYEPLKSAFATYQSLKESRPFIHREFICFNKAVSSYNGSTTLKGSDGSSTIWNIECKVIQHVEVVSLDSILKDVPEVSVLNLNCEGSEIEIIMGTSLANLKKCKCIAIEFHKHSQKLNMTDKMIADCIDKLASLFEVVDKRTYHPYFEFFRK